MRTAGIAWACACAMSLGGGAFADTQDVAAVVAPAANRGWRANAGADFRVRQEAMHNVPGLPGAPGAMMRAPYRKNVNHFRFRPRAWFALDAGESFRLYSRLADETRLHVVKNGVRKDDRAYKFPDELVLDNLWLEGRGLFDGFLDFRAGRQDLFDGRHSVVGLDRLVLDGSPFVGSRSCYADMLRVTLHATDEDRLDLFALYDNGRNLYRWGTDGSRGRPMNAIHPADGPGMDEWGGGGVWKGVLPRGTWPSVRLPYQLYAIHKGTTAYRDFSGAKRRAKEVTTFGARIMPEVTEHVSFDFDGAKQVGRKHGGGQVGGWMGYAAVEAHEFAEGVRHEGWNPFARASFHYLSGDRHRTDDAHDNDTAWDPMWARAPCDSEMFQYGTLYGLGYWSNMMFAKASLGAEFGPHHALVASAGPMWAAEQDGAGHSPEDASGRSEYKGFLSSVRYDFPLLLAPEGAAGADRLEMFGHVLAEAFHPGDYYESSRPAYFVRWEITVKF